MTDSNEQTELKASDAVGDRAEVALLDCKCGAGKPELDWSSVNDHSGYGWQDCYVLCKSQQCGRYVEMTVNSDSRAEAKVAEKMVSASWNELQKAI